MKPKQREQSDYEKVKTDDFIKAKIVDIERDEEHETTWKGEKKVRDCIRFKFMLEGYEQPHYSRWITFTYGDRGNLYNKYLVPLVAGAYPDCDFDIEELKGMVVKLLWAEKVYENGNVFQFIDTVRPFSDQLKYTGSPQETITNPEGEEGVEEIPF